MNLPRRTSGPPVLAAGEVIREGRALRWLGGGRGQPTVVLEAGIGDSSTAWDLVMAAVAPHTRVVAYDRAGLGNSDPPPGLPSVESQVEDLAAVVRSAGGPCVIVGQSWGGLLAQLLVFRYPELVQGLVLVDTYHEDLVGRLPGWVGWLVGVGTERIWLPLRKLTGRASRGQLDEWRGVSTSFGTVRRSALPDVPLVVLSAGRGLPRPLRRRWTALQAGLARSAPRGHHLVVDDAGHDIHRSHPEVVAKAILSVVEEVRANR